MFTAETATTQPGTTAAAFDLETEMSVALVRLHAAEAAQQELQRERESASRIEQVERLRPHIEKCLPEALRDALKLDYDTKHGYARAVVHYGTERWWLERDYRNDTWHIRNEQRDLLSFSNDELLTTDLLLVLAQWREQQQQQDAKQQRSTATSVEPTPEPRELSNYNGDVYSELSCTADWRGVIQTVAEISRRGDVSLTRTSTAQQPHDEDGNLLGDGVERFKLSKSEVAALLAIYAPTVAKLNAPREDSDDDDMPF